MNTILNRVLIILLIFSLTGCYKKDISKKTKHIKKDKIEKIISKMSLEEKIAQMLIIDYDKDHYDEETLNYIKSAPPSGFILMKNNITTYDKTKSLSTSLIKNSKYPLFISIDEEGGNVQRLKNLSDVSLSDIPFMQSLGQLDDESITYQIGKVIAEEVRTIGVNLDFAPDIDIYSNLNNKVIGKRSFGDNPDIVSKHAISLSKGLEDNKVMSVFKHFPGHGDTSEDSHTSLPIVNKTKEDLESFEFIPFKKVIENGAKMIMIGHIALPNITGDNTPASLSKDIVNILKNDLNYNGIIITDALNMGALTENYSNEEIYIKAIEAGCDILLMPKDGIKTVDYIKGKISEERVDESLRKILKYKYKYLSDNILDKSYLGSEEHLSIISKVG